MSEQINLRALPALADYPSSELKLLASAAPARAYAKGDVLCREGTVGQSCFLLATGAVNVTKKTEDGDKVLATLRAGQIVGQLALVDRSPRSASVIADEAVVALELTRDVFEKLLRASSPVALRFQEQIAIAGVRQLRMANQRLTTILNGNKGRAAGSGAHAPSPANHATRESRPALMRVQAGLDDWDVKLEEGHGGVDLDAVSFVRPDSQSVMLTPRAPR